jgi:hypothetical protein
MPVVIMQYYLGASYPLIIWLHLGRALALGALLPSLEPEMVRVYNAMNSKQGAHPPNRLSPARGRKMLLSRGHAVDAVELGLMVPS